MGQALVHGMRAQFPNAEFFLFTPTQDRARALALKVKGTSLADISDMPRDLNWYLLAFKPQTLNEFDFKFAPDSKVLSVLAGVKTSRLMSKFNITKVARLMPNTPSAIGEGANLLFFGEHLSAEEKTELNSLMSATGSIFPMKTEEDLDLVTAFSGSGPALIFEMARIFEAELIKMTEGRVPAREIVLKTFLGSAKLMSVDQNANTTFDELRDQVTSKKGVTYEALEVLKDNKLQDVFASAFKAAYKRTIQLSK